MPMQKPVESLSVTSGSQWRKTREEGVAIELPSGNVPRLRNVPVAVLLMKGTIADPLSPIVAEMLGGKQQKLDKMPADKVAEASVALQSALCRLAFVSPRVVDPPTAGAALQDDEILLEDINDEDQQFVANLLYASVERLAAEQFRQKQAADVFALAESKTVSSSTE